MFPWFAVSSIGIFFNSDSDIYVTYSPHNLLLVLSFSNQTKFPTPFLSSVARKSHLSDCDCYLFFLMSWSPNWENSNLFCLEPTQIGFWWMTMAAELWWLIFYLVHEDVYYWKLCFILYQTKQVVFGIRRISKLSFDRIYVPVFRLMRQWCGCEGGWSRPEKEATAEKVFSVSKLVCLCCVATYG